MWLQALQKEFSSSSSSSSTGFARGGCLARMTRVEVLALICDHLQVRIHRLVGGCVRPFDRPAFRVWVQVGGPRGSSEHS